MRGLDDLEIGALDATNQQLRRRLDAIPPRDVHGEWIRSNIANLREVVRAFDAREYAPPPHFEKILPRAEVATLRGLLDEARALNEECVGMSLGEVDLLLGDDTRPAELRAALRAFF